MLPIIRGSTAAAVIGLATVVLSPAIGPAFAHATLETVEASPDSTYKGVIRIPHGCKGEATNAVRVTIPEGVIGAKPMPKAGWTITIRKGRYAKTYDYFGRPLSEGAQEIVWSNGSLPNDHYDEFVFSARLAPDLPVGGTLYFPVVQECANGSERWVDIPAPGQDAHSLPHRAPQVVLVAQPTPESHETAAPQTYKAGNLVITAPWVRATPRGAPVAGGYLTITKNGREPDRLVGGSFAAAGRFEVHEMSMEGGVMRMRPVADGLEIKPGQTVELKPGGLHLMFMGLKEQLKPGDTVKGTLEFAKAGTVEVAYPVRSMGAGGGHMHD
jgi:uncharacterized protein YcnI/copper(I)-binding protein